ncbi:hypothetical protein AAKU55_005050 [Oxalobacteraceae bacterium GrIS 1.11]
MIPVILALTLLPGILYSMSRRRYYSISLIALAYYMLSIDEGKTLEAFGAPALYVGSTFLFFSNILFCLFLWFFDQRRPLVSNLSQPLVMGSGEWGALYFSVLALFALIILIKVRNGLDFLMLNWYEQRTEGLNLFDGISNLLGFVAFSLVPIFSGKRAKLILLLGVSLCVFAVTGSRAMLFCLAGYFYCKFFLSEKFSTNQRFCVLVGGVLAAFVLHVTSRAVRGIGVGAILDSNFSTLLELVGDSISEGGLSGGEDDITKYYFFVVHKYMDGWSAGFLPTINRIFFIFSPRELFGIELKPLDVTYQVWLAALNDGLFNDNLFLKQLQESADTGNPGSLHFLVWGDALLNFGLIGALLYPAIFSYSLVCFERFLNQSSVVMRSVYLGIGFPSLLMIARGNVVIGLGYIIYTLPVAYVLCKFIDLWRIRYEKKN